jgi:hypothetical protein
MDGLAFEAKKKKKAKSKSKSRKLRPLKSPGPILRKARPYGAVNGGFRKRRRGPSRPVSAKAKANARMRRLENAYAKHGGRDKYLQHLAEVKFTSRDQASRTLESRRSARDALRDKAPTMKL